jgi:geranylgeranyl pyrophosphate synthase
VSAAALLPDFVERVRARVDAELERVLPRPPACPPLISEAMRYSLFAGGKRLRPVLTLAAAAALAQRADPSAPAGAILVDAAVPAACAVELIHTYSLIHDDLPAMDNDTLRRGRPTLHVVYGEGVAILAGDGLQAEAFALLGREPASADPVVVARKLRVSALLAEAAGAAGMVGGQTIDLQAAGQVPRHGLTLDRESLRGMHERKTGALIRAAAVSGAVMAGGDDRAVDAIGAWAAHAGLAFQIVDDILDVEGSAGDLGKSAGKDAASEKPTYPSLYGLERSRTMAAECARQAHAILERADLTGGLLDAVAGWIVERRS